MVLELRTSYESFTSLRPSAAWAVKLSPRKFLTARTGFTRRRKAHLMHHRTFFSAQQHAPGPDWATGPSGVSLHRWCRTVDWGVGPGRLDSRQRERRLRRICPGFAGRSRRTCGPTSCHWGQTSSAWRYLRTSVPCVRLVAVVRREGGHSVTVDPGPVGDVLHWGTFWLWLRSPVFPKLCSFRQTLSQRSRSLLTSGWNF